MLRSRPILLALVGLLRLGFLVVVVTAAGCSDSTGPARQEIDDFSISYSPSEYEAGRGAIMVLGSEGHVDWLASWGGLGRTDIGEVSWQSSNSAAVSVRPVARGATLRAEGLGFAYVTASVQGLSDTTVVIEVVPQPLPLDVLSIHYSPLNEGRYCEACRPETADAGEVVRVVVPAINAFVVDVRASRGGHTVTLESSQLLWESSDSRVSYADNSCRAPDLDEHCNVVAGRMRAWISGLTPGTAEISLTVRNRQTSLVVDVAGS